MTFGRRDPDAIKEMYSDPAASRRESVRRRVLKSAKLSFNFDHSVIDVVLRDISETGARVKMEKTLPGIPEGGAMLRRNLNSEAHEVEIMWMRNGEMGLRFINRVDVEVFLSDSPPMLEMCNAISPTKLLHFLKAASYLGDSELEDAAKQLEIAHDRVLKRLRLLKR